jgi:beta-galactosidase
MGRLQKTINLGWKFYRGECPDAWFAGYDDSAWNTVTLPHDWSVTEPFSREHSSGGGYLAGGVGWYRGIFTLPESAKGKKVWVIFDGVYNNSMVWANSYYLGKRPYGYSTFAYDISHVLGEGGPVRVSVRAEHRQTADSRWFTGSGLYRKVSVVVKEPVYLTRNSVFFSAVRADADRADVSVSADICNETAEEACLTLRSTLFDGADAACVMENAVTLPAGGNLCFAQEGVVIHPRLWSPESPSLYTLITEIVKDGVALDSESVRVGIRTLRFDADKGFFLNGVSMKLKGVCVHHDAGCLGAAVTRPVWERRLNTLKESGCNAIRMSHNPHMPELYDLCDELGFLAMDEAFDEWEGPKNKWSVGHNVYPPKLYGYFEDFPAWHDKDVQEMVMRDRNHPSIALWSIGNEIDYPNDPYCHASFSEMTGNNDASKPAAERRYNPDRPDANRLVPIARRLTALVKECDTTRPVTVAAAFPELSGLTGFCDVPDVCGYNYKEHLYARDHALYPRRVLLGSENGGHYGAWLAVRDQEYVCGQFLWTGIDYLGEARGWPIHGSAAGLLDLAGNKKEAFHFRRSLWAQQPVLQLSTRRREQDLPPVPGITPDIRRWMRREEDGLTWNYSVGDLIDVLCYTNCPEVTLSLNGTPRGVFRLADFEKDGYITVTLPFEPGELKAEAHIAGGPVTSALQTTGAAVRLAAAAYRGLLRADGEDIAQVAIEVTDAAGLRVPDASPMIGVTVDGAAVLLGLENGDLADNTDYSARERRAFRGRLLAYVRSNGSPGPITVRCHAGGHIYPAQAELRAES